MHSNPRPMPHTAVRKPQSDSLLRRKCGFAPIHGWNRRLQLAMLVAVATLDPLAAELPMITTQPFLGYFLVSAKSKMDFRVKAENAEMSLGAMANKRTPVGLPLGMHVVIEEILPDGRANPLPIQTLESTDAASEKLKKVMITGKTVGDASFEITIEPIQGAIAIGGRILEPGNCKNPLRFSIRTDFPNFYVYYPRETTEDKAALHKIVKKDHIALKWRSGERKKLTCDIALDADAKEANGPGIATAEFNVALYSGEKFLFNATEDSSLHLTTLRPGPWLEQCSLVWTPNPATAKEGKSRFLMEVR